MFETRLKSIRSIVVSFVAGLVLTVLITVFCGWAGKGIPNHSNVSQNWHWPGSVPDTWPKVQGNFVGANEIKVYPMVTDTYVATSSTVPGGPYIHGYSYHRMSFGLPFRSARVDILVESMNGPNGYRNHPTIRPFQHGVLLRPLAGLPYQGSVIPLVPMWFGFAANVLVYGSLFYLLAVLYRRLVRHQRLRQWRLARRCLYCGYDIKGLQGCPECGAPVVGGDGMRAKSTA